MATTWTAQQTQPPGTFRRVIFPQLALADTWTNEGPFERRLESAGFTARSLPRTIFAQFRNDGHDGAEIVGTLTEVTLGDDGVISGSGWLLDDENGQRLVRYMRSGALKHNSVDLAEVDYFVNVDFQWDKDFTDDQGKEWFAPIAVKMSFNRSAIGATTFVALPAFANAHGVLDEDSEEVLAALCSDEPLVWDGPTIVNFPDIDTNSITASATPLPKWEDFHIPEPDHFQKILLDEHGVVYGHLGLWNSCHEGVIDRCLRIPTPVDNYASFNKPGVLTDRGIVETGPITLLGGHGRNMAEMHELLAEAANNIENAWADVRVIPGRLGPWMSGRVRPHVQYPEQYMARASRISGWWVDGRLKGICSVTMEAFDVPGSGNIAASLFMGRTDENGEIVEMLAGGPPCDPAPAVSPDGSLKINWEAVTAGDQIVDWAKIAPKIMQYAPTTFNPALSSSAPDFTVTLTEDTTTVEIEGEIGDTNDDLEAAILAELIALDEEDAR